MNRCESRARDAQERQEGREGCAPPAHPAPGGGSKEPLAGALREAPRARCGGRSQPWARGATAEAALSPRSLRLGSGPGVLTARGASWQRLDSHLYTSAPPVVSATARCQGNQRCSGPAGAEPPVAQGNPGLRFPRLSSPTSGSGQWSRARRGLKSAGFLGGHGGRRHPFGMQIGPGTHASTRPLSRGG